jgi:hypothetical protein
MTRDQGERDAVTIEIGYALVTAVVLAGLTGLVLVSPLALFDLGGTATRVVGTVALLGAAAVLVLRLVRVLWRFAGTPSRR